MKYLFPLLAVAVVAASCQSNQTGEVAPPPAEYSDNTNRYGYTGESDYAGETPAPAPQPQQRGGGFFSKLPHKDAAYMGLPLAEAESLAQSRGLESRVVMIDGTPQPGTTDLNPNRVNFRVSNGVVRAVARG